MATKNGVDKAIGCLERVIAPSLERLSEKCSNLGEKCEQLGSAVAENTRRIEKLSEYVRDQGQTMEGRVSRVEGVVEQMEEKVSDKVQLKVLGAIARLQAEKGGSRAGQTNLPLLPDNP